MGASRSVEEGSVRPARSDDQPAAEPRLEIAALLGLACAMLVVGYAVLLVMAASRGAWLIAPGRAPAPADFNGLWAAGRLAAEGRAGEAYHWAALKHVLTQAGRRAGADLQFPFHYPPVFLVGLAPLGRLPYAEAAVVWLALTGAGYLAAVRCVSDRPLAILAALAAPAAFACVYVGQNGLLTAALAGAALAVLPVRPIIAGVLIGLLAYKPQFGVALPFLLAAGGRWRTIAAASACVVATWAAAGAIFGWEIYPRWLEQLTHHDGTLSALGALPPAKLQSLYGLALTLDAPAWLAWAGQIAGALAAVALAARLWRARVPWSLQAAAAIGTMLVVSPYSILYDYPLVSVGIAFVLRDAERCALRRVDAGLLLLAFGAPFAAAALAAPLCPIAAAALLVVAYRRAWAEVTKVSSGSAHPNAAAAAS